MSEMSNIERLEKLTGLNKETMQKILDDVKKNRQLLESCSMHDFSVDVTPEKRVSKKYQCTRCGGAVDDMYKHAYELGLKHASAEVKIERCTLVCTDKCTHYGKCTKIPLGRYKAVL